MNPKSPMAATDNKLKELSSVGYKQGKDYDIVSLKVLEDTLGKAGGGMMDINRMTEPLGYALGGPAGKVGRPTLAPELYEGFEPIHRGYGEALANINNPEYIHKWNMTKPRQPGLDEKLMQDYEPPIPRWGKAKDLGKKTLEGIKGLGSKSIDVLRQLLGSKSAEAGVYIPDETLDKMSIDEIVKEIELLGPPMFGMSVGPNYVQHLRDLANALEKKIGD